jgi:5-methylcytosine-specific restriction endonuclease McrA
MPTGWIGSTRKETLPPDWDKIRRGVLRRDAYRCQHIRYDTERKCGRTARDVDHIEGRLDHRPENLQSLCGWHHDEKTNHDAGVASGEARRKKAEGSKKKHPGLLA